MLHPKVLPQFYVALCYVLIYCFCLKVVETSQNGKFLKLPRAYCCFIYIVKSMVLYLLALLGLVEELVFKFMFLDADAILMTCFSPFLLHLAAL